MKPILFSAQMIRALLDGRKTMTRRVIKPQPFPVGGPFYQPHPTTSPREWHSLNRQGAITNIQTLPHAVGDLLWVRETWAYWPLQGDHDPKDGVTYRATDEDEWDCRMFDWRPSIHMPRWASRLTLRVTDVRVQRVQDITPADAIAEGIRPSANSQSIDCDTPNPVDEYRDLWDSLNAKRGYGWDKNPWVAALTFDVIRKNIDDLIPEDSE